MARPTRRSIVSARLAWLVLATAVLVVASKGESVLADNLNVGDPAPEFSLPGSDGRTYSLSAYRGKEVVVLAWFPKAFTGG